MGNGKSLHCNLKTRARTFLALAVFVLFWACCASFRQAGAESAGADARGASAVSDSHTYRRKPNITTVLLMGIDTRGSAQRGVGARKGGQADFLQLLVIDRSEEKISQLAIDRDTMAEITVLDVLGEDAGVRVDNISLSHYFGDGGRKSCALTRKAVSELLLGARIDYYLAMNLDGIARLNDALGGVTVILEDDLSSLDPSWTAGTAVTLHGSEAEAFLRARMTVGDGTNRARMRRQQQYISQAARLLQNRIGEDAGFIGKVFDALSPYLVTNFSRSEIISEAYAVRNYSHGPVITLAGEYTVSEDGFMQFWPDEERLRDTVLDLLLIEAD